VSVSQFFGCRAISGNIGDFIAMVQARMLIPNSIVTIGCPIPKKFAINTQQHIGTLLPITLPMRLD